MKYFISDHHWDHFNILKYDKRSKEYGGQFESFAHMKEELMKRHNEVITDEDEVFFLGDFSFKMSTVEAVMPKLKGIKYLVPGNHDKAWRGNKQVVERYEWSDVKVLGKQVKIKIDDEEVLLSHLPYINHDPRYIDLLPKDEGLTLLHGHCHHAWHVNKESKSLQINVGCMHNNFYPFSEDQIKTIIIENRYE